MKLSLSTMMALAETINTTALFGQSSQNEPTRQEIAEA
jgi:hypothetical protein